MSEGKNKIPLAAIIAYNNPDGANEIISKFGLPVHTTSAGKYKALSYILTKKGEEALTEFALHHPDRGLILATKTESSNACGCSAADGKSCCDSCDKLKENFSGCDSCGGTCGKKKCGTSSAEGKMESAVMPSKNEKESQLPLIVVGCVAVIGIIALFKN